MNETSNISSNSTGGVCSSCLKEMPLIMTSSSSSRLCSNCISEFIDPQQPFSLSLNNKFPLFSSSQPLPSTQQHQQQQSQSLIQPHFSPLSSSSASSTSSLSSTNRRFSAFDPFTSGNDIKSSFLNPFNDFNNAFSTLSSSNLTNNNSDFENTTSDFMRYFHNFLNGNNHNNIGDRDSPTSSIQSNDFPPLFASTSTNNNNNHLPSQSLLQRQHSVFSSIDSTTSSTPSLNRSLTNDLPSTLCCFANNPPYTYCMDCETSLCEKCALTHPKMLGFKDHRQQLLSSQLSINNHNNNINTTRSIIGQPPRQQPPDILPLGAGKFVCHLNIYLFTKQGHLI